MLNIWRELNPKEEKKFKLWATNNYQPGTTINTTWHPVVREECDKINKAAQQFGSPQSQEQTPCK